MGSIGLRPQGRQTHGSYLSYKLSVAAQPWSALSGVSVIFESDDNECIGPYNLSSSFMKFEGRMGHPMPEGKTFTSCKTEMHVGLIIQKSQILVPCRPIARQWVTKLL